MRKTQKFCKIIALDLSYVVTVKSKVEILQNFVALSEYINFNLKSLKLWTHPSGRVGRGKAGQAPVSPSHP